MSMISAQIDELRVMAQLEKSLERPAIASALSDAADTIWQLRCRLVDAEDRVRKSGELCKLCEREAENAKLQELAEKAWKAAEMLCQAWDGPCHADGVSIKTPCPLDERDELCVYGLIQRDLHELGVEVSA